MELLNILRHQQVLTDRMLIPESFFGDTVCCLSFDNVLIAAVSRVRPAGVIHPKRQNREHTLPTVYFGAERNLTTIRGEQRQYFVVVLIPIAVSAYLAVIDAGDSAESISLLYIVTRCLNVDISIV